MSMPSVAKPTSWRMPIPLSSRLGKNVRALLDFSAQCSKPTSLVVKDLFTRRCLGQKEIKTKITVKFVKAWKN